MLGTLESIAVTAVRPARSSRFQVMSGRSTQADDSPAPVERGDDPKAEIRVLAEPQARIEGSGEFQQRTTQCVRARQEQASVAPQQTLTVRREQHIAGNAAVHHPRSAADELRGQDTERTPPRMKSASSDSAVSSASSRVTISPRASLSARLRAALTPPWVVLITRTRAVADRGGETCGVVERPVVDDDELPVLVRLVDHRANRRQDRRRCVVCRCDNAELHGRLPPIDASQSPTSRPLWRLTDATHR